MNSLSRSVARRRGRVFRKSRVCRVSETVINLIRRILTLVLRRVGRDSLTERIRGGITTGFMLRLVVVTSGLPLWELNQAATIERDEVPVAALLTAG
jgi:hypothetical protein